MNVVLVGFSGTGKSRVGQLLADFLGWELVDTDLEVERVARRRIHEIFAQDGEATFRLLEKRAVLSALDQAERVIAVGGGAVLDAESRDAMRRGNLVVLLEASPDTLHRRLAADLSSEPRPLLAARDPHAAISALKGSRDHLYREMAQLVVDTDGLSAEDVARRVAEAVRN